MLTAADLTISPLEPQHRTAWLRLWQAYQAHYEAKLPVETTTLTWQRFHDPAVPIFVLGAFRGGQLIGASGFLQMHGGIEIPTDSVKGDREAFLRTAVGFTLAGDRGRGRSWSPMVEVLAARPWRSETEWDIVPQMQVSLSRLQHVRASVGLRVPLNERTDRHPQVLTYVLWDWFDGGFFKFWH